MQKQKSCIRSLVNIPLCIIVLFVGALITYSSIDYLNPDFAKGYLIDKKEVFYGVFRVGLYLHMIFAPLGLLLGTILVLFRIEKYKKTHRLLGYQYIANSVLVTFSGIILGFYAFGGLLSKLNFILLSSFFGIFVFKAYVNIRKRRVNLHKRFMTRSYILILSAINLRVLSFIFINFLGYSGKLTYLLIGMMSWIPFLIMYEVSLWIKSAKKNNAF